MKKIKILAVTSAIATFILILIQGMLNQQEIQQVQDQKISVLVAAADIPAHTRITEEMLMIREVNGELFADALASPDMAIGKYAKSYIYQDEPILEKKLGERATDDASAALEGGKRGITVAVDLEMGIGSLLTPGNYVDVLAVLPAAPVEAEASKARILLQGIEVLAVDHEYNADTFQSDKGLEYSSVTLSVTPEEALKLTLAQSEGEIRLVLRNPLDTEYGRTSDVYIEDLLR